MPNQTDIQSDPMPMGSMKRYISTIDQMTFSHTLFKISSITIHFLMSYNFSFLFLQRVFCNKWASELHLHSADTGSLFSEWERRVSYPRKNYQYWLIFLSCLGTHPSHSENRNVWMNIRRCFMEVAASFSLTTWITYAFSLHMSSVFTVGRMCSSVRRNCQSACIVNSFSSRNISFSLWKTEMCEWTSGAVLGRLLEVAAFICLTQCG